MNPLGSPDSAVYLSPERQRPGDENTEDSISECCRIVNDYTKFHEYPKISKSFMGVSIGSGAEVFVEKIL
jgi:hypothetical protein